MRYLYGDSVPFPLQYNFLSTLETFVTCAARAVQLHREFDQAHAGTSAAAALRAKALGELENVHRQVLRTVHDAVVRSSDPATLDYARQVEDQATRIVDAAKSSATVASEREQAQIRADAERRRQDIRAAMENFLIIGRLPALDSRVSMRLVNGRNEMSAVISSADGIVTSFTLAASQVPSWYGPRKVGEFANGVDLQVGIRRSLFKRTVHPEVVHLDDFVFGGFELAEDHAEMRLRRRSDQPDTLIFKLHRMDTELIADVLRPGEDAEGVPTHVDAGDKVQLERLWQLLRAAVAEPLTRRETLVSVTMDGQDVFENDLVVQFIQRIIKQLAPTVAEIARRSPNPQELSLKHEDDAGRREEIYVRKHDLSSKLEPLDKEGRAVFAALGLSPRDPSIETLSADDVRLED
jgi:hypothetical protein